MFHSFMQCSPFLSLSLSLRHCKPPLSLTFSFFAILTTITACLQCVFLWFKAKATLSIITELFSRQQKHTDTNMHAFIYQRHATHSHVLDFSHLLSWLSPFLCAIITAGAVIQLWFNSLRAFQHNECSECAGTNSLFIHQAAELLKSKTRPL